MAMLAEPRQRKRYNLVPRGKALYEDDSRFGTKMLEKMGWSKGKGLGTNEDGSKDFVRVRYKNDIQGLGYEQRDDQWTQHESSFSSLLKSLNGDSSEANGAIGEVSAESGDERPTFGFGFSEQQCTKKDKKANKLKANISGISLEEKSKQSKARVHYKKFTKGKDLSQYSEKDLANIFGKKDAEDPVAAAGDIFQQLSQSTKVTDTPKEENTISESFGGVQTISTGLSVSDYFKLKMSALKNKKAEKSDQTITDSCCENEADANSMEASKKKKKKKREVPAEHDNAKQETKEDSGGYEQSADIIEKKKKKKNYVLAEHDNAKQESEEDRNGYKQSTDIIEKKKKKKRDLSTEHDNANEPSYQKPRKMESEEDTPSTDITEKMKKKKRKKSSECEQTEDPTNVALNDLYYSPEDEQPLKKKRHEECEVVMSPTEIESNGLQKKKKKSKQQHHSGDTEKEPRENVEQNNSCNTTVTKEKAPNTMEHIVQDEHNKVLDKKKCKKRDKKVNTSDDSTDTKVAKKTQEIAVSGLQEANDLDDIRNMHLQTMQTKLNSFNVYRISSFSAEKFRNLDLSYFPKSALPQIVGYALNNDVQLEVDILKSDEMRITRLWDNTLSKYALMEKKTKKAYQKYVHQTRKAWKNNEKRPSLHFKKWKRKNAFAIV